MAISDCLRCGAKVPGEHDGWRGFRHWMVLELPQETDDLSVVCPACMTDDELNDQECEKAEDAAAARRDAPKLAAALDDWFARAGLSEP